MLERLTVRNYKSLEEVTLKLRPLNVFVGPNNCGKSNILDCLQFLTDFITQGAGAVHSRGGFGTLVWGGDLRRTISIELEGMLTTASYIITVGVEGFSPARQVMASRKLPYTYELHLAGGPTHYNLTKESVAIQHNNSAQKILEFPSSEPATAQIWDEEGRHLLSVAYSSESYLKYALQLPQKHPLTLRALAVAISDWRSYRLVPARMRHPLPVKKDVRLQFEGENLPVVLHSLQSEYRDDFQRIVETLRTGIPELQELYAAITEQGSTYISVKEQGLDQRIPAWAMSDGTLQLLAFLAVLYSPSPPPLACFEEPENFLHPHLLKLLADLLREASERTQILVTTHSPYLLNFMDPADLVIVEKSEGKTKVKRPSAQKALKEALRVLHLGEMWYSGSLGGVPSPP